MTPRLPAPKERTVQRQIVAGLRQIGLGVVAIPNGGEYRGSPEMRARMAIARRQEGVVSGFPDLMVLSKRGAPMTCFLEVKRPGVSLSGEHVARQLECHAALTADGHNVAIVRSLDDAIAAVKSWGMI